MGSNKGNIPDEGVIWDSLIIIIGCRPTLPILIRQFLDKTKTRGVWGHDECQEWGETKFCQS